MKISIIFFSIIFVTNGNIIAQTIEQIQISQQDLNKLGYLKVKPDGIWGAKSSGALKSFLEDNGRPVLELLNEFIIAELDSRTGVDTVISWIYLKDCIYFSERKLENRLKVKDNVWTMIDENEWIKLATGVSRGGILDGIGIGTYLLVPVNEEIDLCAQHLGDCQAWITKRGFEIDFNTSPTKINIEKVGHSQQDSINYYKNLAEKGDANSQCKMGLFHAEGNIVPQNYPLAIEWFEKAAKQGHNDAMVRLGILFASGKGVERNNTKAKEWFEKAALGGNSDAMNSLGGFYLSGSGGTKDFMKAKEYYEKAAEKGNVMALNNLAQMNYFGDGMPVNKTEALNLFQQATDKGSISAQFNLGLMYYNGDGVPKDEEKGLGLIDKSAQKGYDKAIKFLKAKSKN